MKYLSRICLLALVGLMPLTPLAAQQNKGIGAWQPVKDEVGFFSAGAKEQADRKISGLKKTLNKDLCIEAIKSPAIPKDLDAKGKAAFFDQFAEKRFASLHENGVLVMIVDNPHILRVVVGNNTRVEGYFTEANRKTLIDKMLEKMKAGDKDGALQFASEYVPETMQSHHLTVHRKGAEVVAPAGAPVDHARQAGFNWTPIIMIVAIVAGVWVLMAIVRAIFRPAGGGLGGPGMGYGGGGGGGGGFLSSLVGGMFGAAAGMWMYNSFFGHGGSSAWGAGGNDATAGGSYPDSGPADTSGSAAGGDYGNDDGGGGDAGGGDAGGGDWGGGGGGGGDWGGGGGGDFGGGGGGGDW